MGGLKQGGQYLSFKQRLATVRACYLSKLFYSIECWGHGLTQAQLQSLQAAQNRVLRWVTATPPRTSSALNLRTCGQLSVVQTIAFRTLFSGLKILFDKKPRNLFSALHQNNRNRRSERHQNNLRRPSRGFYQNRHWRNNFLVLYNQLPVELKSNCEDIRRALPKRKLKT